jgi:hypothetical protein
VSSDASKDNKACSSVLPSADSGAGELSEPLHARGESPRRTKATGFFNDMIRRQSTTFQSGTIQRPE